MKNLTLDSETAIRYGLSLDSAYCLAGFREYYIDADVNRWIDSGGQVYVEMVPKVFIQYIPLLQITEKSASDSVNRRFKKIVESGLIRKYDGTGYAKPYYTVLLEPDRPLVSSGIEEIKEIDGNRPGPGSVQILEYKGFIDEMEVKYTGKLDRKTLVSEMDTMKNWLIANNRRKANYESYCQIWLNKKVNQNGTSKTKIFDGDKVSKAVDYIRRGS